MGQLNQQKCVACRRDSPPVTEEEVAELQPQVSDWDLITEDGVKKLDRVFRFADFRQALDFTHVLGSWPKRKATIRDSLPNGGGLKLLGGPIRSGTSTPTISLWLPSRTGFTRSLQ